MRPLLAFTVALGALGFVYGFQTSGPLAAWVAKVNGLKSLRAEIVLTEPGQGSQSARVAMQKPSSLRVEDEAQTVVADGTTVTVLEKARGIWYARPQAEVSLASLLKPDQYALVRAFFDPKAFAGARARAGEARTLAGETVRPVDVALDAKGKKTMTFYIGADGLSRKAERRLETPDGRRSAVLTAKDIVLDAAIPDGEFAFRAPDGAKEVAYADLVTSKWFTDLDEAKTVAAAAGKRIFLDFTSPRSPLNRTIEAEVYATDAFRALSSKYVFCRIDADVQPGVAQELGIEALPTQVVTDAAGKELGRSVGYMGAEELLRFARDLGGAAQ